MEKHNLKKEATRTKIRNTYGCTYYTSWLEKENLCIIDSECSNHITKDKRKFINFKKFDGATMKLGSKSIEKKMQQGYFEFS